VLAINKQPIARVVDAFRRKEIGDNVRGTDLALATMYLTKRVGALGHEVPRGEVKLKVLKKESGKTDSYTTEWDYHEEKIGDPFVHRMAKNLFSKAQCRKDFHHKSYLCPHYVRLQECMPKSDRSLNYFGAREGCLPPFGEIIWESSPENTFQAYLFRLPQGDVAGYVRIPTYGVDDEEEAVADFEEVIAKMEAEASVLVIDQMNNPGGNLFYLYALATRLTPYPLYVPTERIMLTQEQVAIALDDIDQLEDIPDDQTARERLGESIRGIYVTQKITDGMLDYAQQIVSQWNRGKRFTDALHMYGFESIEPHPTFRYTKPILLIINYMDFSSADFFAAIMQDNQRATLIGTRTAGAGGYVEKMSVTNLTGIRDIGVTGSFAERTNGMPIENLGVEPDILYEFTVSDLQNQYTDFKTKVLKELQHMMEK
jgi:hypothetical protein